TRWDFVADKTLLRMWLDSSEPEELFGVIGIGYNVDQKVPCLVRRRQARQTRFVAAYDLSGSGTEIRRLRSELLVDREPKTEVETREGLLVVRFTSNEPLVERQAVSNTNAN